MKQMQMMMQPCRVQALADDDAALKPFKRAFKGFKGESLDDAALKHLKAFEGLEIALQMQMMMMQMMHPCSLEDPCKVQAIEAGCKIHHIRYTLAHYIIYMLYAL